MTAVPSATNLTPNLQDMVAKFVHYCGVKSNMNYQCNASGAWPHNFEDFDLLGYQWNIANGAPSHNKLYNNIMEGRPAIIVGYSESEGHTWILDGMEYDYYNPPVFWYRIHCNFGWNGTDNGWFKFPPGEILDYTIRIYTIHCISTVSMKKQTLITKHIQDPMNKFILLLLIVGAMIACDNEEVIPEKELTALEVSARDTVVPYYGNRLKIAVQPSGWSLIKACMIEGQDTTVFNNPISASGTYPKRLYTGCIDCYEREDHVEMWIHQNMGKKRYFMLEIGGDGFQSLILHIEQERDPMEGQEWPDPPTQ